MDFGEILTRAWSIIWRNKVLWLFGLFASMGAGGSNAGTNGRTYNLSLPGDNPSPDSPRFLFENLPPLFQRFLTNAYIWVPILILFALLLIAGLIVLNTFGRIGLARGAWVADQTNQKVSFRELWDWGKRYFWRVLLLMVVLWALAAALSILTTVLGVFMLCLLPLLCVLGIALWAITVMADLSIVALVNEDLGISEAVGRGWAVLTTRPLEIFGMGIILWFGSLIVGFIASIPLLIIVAPLIAMLMTQSEIILHTGIVFALVLFLLYLPVLLSVQALIQSYTASVWTLVFRRITKQPVGQLQPQPVA